MRHRSTLRRTLALAVAVTCALPALAAAADTIPVPADAPTVATSPSGATVIAWVVGGRRLCATVQLAGAPRPAEIRDAVDSPAGEPPGSCEPLPVFAAFDATSAGTAVITPDRHMTWGWTGTGAGTVELRRRGTVFGTGPTTPSPLLGAAADLRFFAVEHPAGPRVGDESPDPASVVRPDELILRDAFGVVRRATDLVEPRPARGPVLQRGKGWVLGQTVTRVLAPTPLDAARRETRRCLQLRRADDSGLLDLCDGDPDGRPYLMQTSVGCSSGSRLVVLAREPAVRVVAILGDGRRRTVPLAALSPGTRAGALFLGSRVAVRRTLALSAAGKVLLAQPLGIPPLSRNGCLDSGGLFGSGPSAPRPLADGPHALHVTDHGVRICVAAGRAPQVPQECALPPVDPDQARLSVRRTPSGRVVLGIVPAEIAAVRVTTRADRRGQTAATAPVAGYAGPYAAALRQVVLELPGSSPVTDVAALDARGRALSPHAGAEPVPLRPLRTVLRAPGVPPLWVGVDSPSGSSPASCLSLGSAFTSCAAIVQRRGTGAALAFVSVTARCAPRRIAVVAVLRRRSDRLVVRTASGRVLLARRARIPAGSGPASGLYAQLAVLGPRDGIRTIAQRGRVPRSIPVALPPAGRQCGYSALPGIS